MEEVASLYYYFPFSSNTKITPSINNHIIRELNMVTVSIQNFFQGDETPSLKLYTVHRCVMKMGRKSMCLES